MKKYRIKNYEDIGYIVQIRYSIFFWYTIVENFMIYINNPKIFVLLCDAKAYVQDRKDKEEAIKKAEYKEYV